MLEKTHYSKSGLKYRGWTNASIVKFLKTHDSEAINPYYKSSATMKLYLIDRVELIENTKEFKDFLVQSKLRKESSKKAIETKKAKLINDITIWQPIVKKEDYNKIVKESIKSYNNFKQDIALERNNFDFVPASLRSDKEFLQRIVVNHLRHQFTNYEDKLESIYGKVGKGEVYKIINRKIYSAIASTYPSLKNECKKQFDRKYIDENMSYWGELKC